MPYIDRVGDTTILGICSVVSGIFGVGATSTGIYFSGKFGKIKVFRKDNVELEL